MAEFTFGPALVLVQDTDTPAPEGTTGVLRPKGGGDPLPIWDLNNSPITSVRVGRFGVHQAFRADVHQGELDFGSVLLNKLSDEAQVAAIAR